MTDTNQSPPDQRPLKQAVQEKIAKVQLNNTQLEQLMAMQQKAEQSQASLDDSELDAKPNRRGVIFVAMAAMIFGLGVLIQPQTWWQQEIPIPQKIANEVAYNHLKLKPLEVTSSRLPTVSEYFTELDFAPTTSSIIEESAWELLGARYCSIQGYAAAQIRFKNTHSGELETFYEAEYVPAVHGELPVIENQQLPLRVFAKGITVEIWVEKGLLMARTLHE